MKSETKNEHLGQFRLFNGRELTVTYTKNGR